MKEKVYHCENCGGIMEFDAKTQSLKCPNCDTMVPIAHHQEDIVEHSFTPSAIRSYSIQEKPSSTMECSGCGATIEVAGDATAAICPYCGSSYVLAEKQESAIIPDGVIPFQIDKSKVKELFHVWIKKRYFAPSNLKHLYQRGNIQGRYIPYWTFDALCQVSYTGMGGRNRTETYKDSEGKTKTKTVIDWYHTSGWFRHFFDDILVKATKHVNSSLIEGVDSYNTREVVSYSPEYFSGYLSEKYTVDLQTAHQEAEQEMRQKLHTMAEADILKTYDHARDVRLNVRYEQETFKHIIVPVYAASYSYKNKNYTVLINGQNGEIKGEYPKSIAKIAGLIAAILLLVLGLYFVLENSEEQAAVWTAPLDSSEQVSYMEEQEMEGYMIMIQDLDAVWSVCLSEEQKPDII